MRTVFLTAAAILVFWVSGCSTNNLACNDCSSCRGLARPRLPGQPAYVGHLPHATQDAGPPGPPTAAYAYPYYTTRGPRDFLLDGPPTIGR